MAGVCASRCVLSISLNNHGTNCWPGMCRHGRWGATGGQGWPAPACAAQAAHRPPSCRHASRSGAPSVTPQPAAALPPPLLCGAEGGCRTCASTAAAHGRHQQLRGRGWRARPQAAAHLWGGRREGTRQPGEHATGRQPRIANLHGPPMHNKKMQIKQALTAVSNHHLQRIGGRERPWLEAWVGARLAAPAMQQLPGAPHPAVPSAPHAPPAGPRHSSARLSPAPCKQAPPTQAPCCPPALAPCSWAGPTGSPRPRSCTQRPCPPARGQTPRGGRPAAGRWRLGAQRARGGWVVPA